MELHIYREAKINSLRDVIGKKVKVPEATPNIQVPQFSQRKEVDLKKSEPPKFNGNVIEFPEFKRKWKALVSKAGLPEESEVDKLKDAVTKEGKDTLFGATNMDEAWKRLDKIFGDPRIISNKLKNDLKNVKSEGKTDTEKIKNLKMKVDILVTQMKTQKCDSVLEADPEFLIQCVFRHAKLL